MKKQYSGKRIIKAGEQLLDDSLIETDADAFYEAADILSFWRFSHEVALEKAFLLIQDVSLRHDKEAIFAKRLKRMVSIVRKLKRFQKMKLKNMQDIGGCRIILTSEKRLRKVLRDLRKKPEFRLEKGFRAKDYIQKPKDDGYRGYHLIGKFEDAKGQVKSIEIQLRTQIEHYWATALEIVDLFTGQALKSNLGDKQWKDFFLNVSQQFAVMETIHLYENLEFEEKFQKYTEVLNGKNNELISCGKVQKYSNSLNVVERFNAFAASLQVVDTKLTALEATEYGYVLLEIDIPNSNVSTSFFPNDKPQDAEEAYISSEKEAAGND